MADLIADIGASDTRLVLATAKPIESAERVLSKAGLIGYFDFVSGTELDLLRQDKPSVIAHGIDAIGADVSTVDAVMVGDRKEDVLGARHFGFRSAGVLWGYGDEGELEAVGPSYLVASPDELRAVLGF
jgi:phosphoglycolate phosphatase